METPVHRHACEVAFGDTDASGWMHFPNVFRYVEAAEHDFLRKRGILVFDRSQGGWPRVKVSCDYKRPLHGGDRVEVLYPFRGWGPRRLLGILKSSIQPEKSPRLGA